MRLLILLITCTIIYTNTTYSQFGIIESKLKEKVEQKIEEKINEEEINENEEKSQKQESNSENQQIDDNQNNKQSSKPPTMQTFSKYDFIPGEKVIFFDDFSQEAVGDFPSQWNTNGTAEVVTTSLYPGKWLKYEGDVSVWTDKLLDLPENYTIEFDVVPIEHDGSIVGAYVFRLIQAENAHAFDGGGVPGKAGFEYVVEYLGRSGYRTYINNVEENYGLSGYKDDENTYQHFGNKYHIAIWVQKSRLRLYMNEYKMFDLPKAFPLTTNKMDRIRFDFGVALVSNVRIAVGTPDMRNKLLTEGKLVSYGLYFDSGKDVLKPESYGTLKGIADVLKENPNVRIKIIGHTDSDGNDASNLELSKKRSAAVMNELVKTFGIDASRIVTDGMGETAPIAPNDIPANKALNRRVEFLKL